MCGHQSKYCNNPTQQSLTSGEAQARGYLPYETMTMTELVFFVLCELL